MKDDKKCRVYHLLISPCSFDGGSWKPTIILKIQIWRNVICATIYLNSILKELRQQFIIFVAKKKMFFSWFNFFIFVNLSRYNFPELLWVFPLLLGWTSRLTSETDTDSNVLWFFIWAVFPGLDCIIFTTLIDLVTINVMNFFIKKTDFPYVAFASISSSIHPLFAFFRK